MSKNSEVKFISLIHLISEESFARHALGHCHDELVFFDWPMLDGNLAVHGTYCWSPSNISILWCFCQDSNHSRWFHLLTTKSLYAALALARTFVPHNNSATVSQLYRDCFSSYILIQNGFCCTEKCRAYLMAVLLISFHSAHFFFIFNLVQMSKNC